MTKKAAHSFEPFVTVNKLLASEAGDGDAKVKETDKHFKKM